MTRKVSHSVARIKAGLTDTLLLGDLHPQRDWGYAPDYVEAMWLMLQQDGPDDYVIAQGKTNSVQEFCELAFSHVGLDWRDHVRQNDKFRRPAEVDQLVGNPAKARERLGWVPKTTFEELDTIMVDADLHQVADQVAHDATRAVVIP